MFAEVAVAALDLLIDGGNMERQKAVELVLIPFLLRKRASFVEQRIIEEFFRSHALRIKDRLLIYNVLVGDNSWLFLFEQLDDDDPPDDEEGDQPFGEEMLQLKKLQAQDEGCSDSFRASVDKDVDDGLRLEFFFDFERDVEHLFDYAKEGKVDRFDRRKRDGDHPKAGTDQKADRVAA